MRRGRSGAIAAVVAGVLVAPGGAAQAAEGSEDLARLTINVHAPDGAWEGWYRHAVNIQADVDWLFPLLQSDWSRENPDGSIEGGRLDPSGTGFAVSTRGVTRFTFTARELNGDPVVKTYNVGYDPDAPNVAFGSMATSIVVGQGSNVPFVYSCTEVLTVLKSCVGEASSGQPLDTRTKGEFRSPVRSEDMVGNVGVRNLTYTVVDPMVTQEPPRITGTPRVGSTLRVDGGTFTPAAEQREIRWFRGETQVGTGETYELVDADAGQTMRAHVVGSRRYFASVAAWSATSAKVQKREFESTGTLRVRGDAVVGRQLALDLPTVTPAASATTFQWYRNGGAIAGATSPTYDVTTQDVGATLSGGVEFTRADREPLKTFTTASQPVLAPLVVDRQVAIRGSSIVGRTLTAVAPQFSAPVDRLTYAWLRDGTPIAAATSTSYRLTAADVGRRITVRVIARSARRPDAQSRSVSTAKIARAAASLKATASARGKKRVRITARVAAASVAVTGKITVYRGSKVVGRGSVSRSGKATVNLTRQPRSRIAYKVVYSGSSWVGSKTIKTARIRVR